MSLKSPPRPRCISVAKLRSVRSSAALKHARQCGQLFDFARRIFIRAQIHVCPSAHKRSFTRLRPTARVAVASHSQRRQRATAFDDMSPAVGAWRTFMYGSQTRASRERKRAEAPAGRGGVAAHCAAAAASLGAAAARIGLRHVAELRSSAATAGEQYLRAAAGRSCSCSFGAVEAGAGGAAPRSRNVARWRLFTRCVTRERAGRTVLQYAPTAERGGHYCDLYARVQRCVLLRVAVARGVGRAVKKETSWRLLKMNRRRADLPSSWSHDTHPPPS